MSLVPLEAIDYESGMQAANIYINSLPCVSGVSSSVKALAIKYYAAHLVFIADPCKYVKRQKFVNDEKEYALPVLGEGYKASPFGQFANELLGGCLESAGKQKPVLFFAGGC